MLSDKMKVTSIVCPQNKSVFIYDYHGIYNWINTNEFCMFSTNSYITKYSMWTLEVCRIMWEYKFIKCLEAHKFSNLLIQMNHLCKSTSSSHVNSISLIVHKHFGGMKTRIIYGAISINRI